MGVDSSSLYRLIERQKLRAGRAPLGKLLIPQTELSRILKFPRRELVLCKRIACGADEFGVVERFKPDSPLAQAQGERQLQMTSNDARLLLQDFVEGERRIAQLRAQDIIGTSRELVQEKFPDRDLGRVIKAIAQRCSKTISNDEKIVPAHAPAHAEGVRV